jgi:hypothetical protein
VIAKCVSQTLDQCALPHFVEFLQPIIQWITSPDARIAAEGVDSVSSICLNVPLDTFPIEPIAPICDALLRTADRTQLRLLEIVDRFSGDARLGDAVIAAHVNYEALLFNRASRDIVRASLNIIVKLLPTMKSGPHQFAPRRPKTACPTTAPQFAQEVQPLLLRALTDHIGHEGLTVAALTSSLKYAHPDLTPKLMNTLCGLTQQPDLAPAILLFAIGLADIAPVVKSGLLARLQAVTLDGKMKDWFSKQLDHFTQRFGAQKVEPIVDLRKCQTLREAFEAGGSVSAFQLLQKGFLGRVSRGLARSDAPLPISAAAPFVANLLELAVFLPFDARNGRSLERVRERPLLIKTSGDATVSATVNSLDSLVAAEAIYNEASHETLVPGGRVRDIVAVPERAPDMTAGEIGWLHRIFGTPGYKRLRFKSGDSYVSAKDYAVRMAKTVRTHLTAEAEADGDDFAPLSGLRAEKSVLDATLVAVLDLIAGIRRRCPEVSVFSEFLDGKVRDGLSSPGRVVTRRSPAVALAVNYPFLLSFAVRSAIVRM